MGAGIEGYGRDRTDRRGLDAGGGTVGRPPLAGTLLVVAGGLGYACGRAALVCRLAGRGDRILVSCLGRRRTWSSPATVRRALLAIDGAAPVLVGRADDFETGLWLAAVGDPRRRRPEPRLPDPL